MIDQILTFWFEELGPEDWFSGDKEIDIEICKRFGKVHSEVARGEHFGWRETLRGRLAEIIVLDQFSRNIYRGHWKAFAQDNMALALAQECIANEDITTLSSDARQFLFMPFMHSESLCIHDQALKLFKSDPNLADALKFEEAHRKIIVEFGRYPNRNDALSRENTPEEIAFLKEGKGF